MITTKLTKHKIELKPNVIQVHNFSVCADSFKRPPHLRVHSCFPNLAWHHLTTLVSPSSHPPPHIYRALHTSLAYSPGSRHLPPHIIALAKGLPKDIFCTNSTAFNVQLLLLFLCLGRKWFDKIKLGRYKDTWYYFLNVSSEKMKFLYWLTK